MPRTAGWLAAMPRLPGVRLACSVHLDAKMVPFFEGLIEHDVELFLTTCNPTTVRDEVVDHLRAGGANVTAHKGMSTEELEESHRLAIAWGPSHLCEMGADLSRVAPDVRHSSILAGLEAIMSPGNRTG